MFFTLKKKEFNINQLVKESIFAKRGGENVCLVKRILGYMVENSYKDTGISVRKVGISGLIGYIEHTSVINQFIKKAKQDKKNFAKV